MHRFEKRSFEESFIPCGKPIPIVVGQKGIAWGLGLHETPSDVPAERLKVEGDRKAPAGIFRLGEIFIDSRFNPSVLFMMPVIIADEHYEAVDDPGSRFYNQLVNTANVEMKDWKSSEVMQRDDAIYHLGLVIHHNSLPVVPGRGSCIFMHSWRGNESGTYGCTALSNSDLLEVLQWLDEGKSPLIVQLPLEEYLNRIEEWNLPEIP